ncbi:hypothetical protein GCM10009114_11260 [Aliiglaciecola litoralis]|uniref:Uncharacterized protein n=1 Tax=Aliiglaciecola litoralis TaxID=582857 RepID=A0ABN1LEL7_9ALTE
MFGIYNRLSILKGRVANIGFTFVRLVCQTLSYRQFNNVRFKNTKLLETNITRYSMFCDA